VAIQAFFTLTKGGAMIEASVGRQKFSCEPIDGKRQRAPTGGHTMRHSLVVAAMLLFPLKSAVAQVSVQIGLPNVRIGINLPVYPQLVPVPGYPVYYAPRVDSNYFFYDGMYWVYVDDNWYASYWYNGPWALVAPEVVPVYVLRIPVRYYRQPPPYFHGWQPDAPPRWGEHWGNDWERRHGGWDKWDRKSAPRPAPLPVYQRKYSGDRYPQAELQPKLHGTYYRYQPRDPAVKQTYEAHGVRAGPPPKRPPARTQGPDAQRASPPPHPGPGMGAPHEQAPRAPDRDGGHEGKGGAPQQDRGHQGKEGAPEPKGKSGHSKGEERGSGHDK